MYAPCNGGGITDPIVFKTSIGSMLVSRSAGNLKLPTPLKALSTLCRPSTSSSGGNSLCASRVFTNLSSSSKGAPRSDLLVLICETAAWNSSSMKIFSSTDRVSSGSRLIKRCTTGTVGTSASAPFRSPSRTLSTTGRSVFTFSPASLTFRKIPHVYINGTISCVPPKKSRHFKKFSSTKERSVSPLSDHALKNL